MKKYLSIFMLMTGILIIASGPLFAQKMGYTNSIAILSAMPETTQADEILTAYQNELQNQGQVMAESLQQRFQEYMNLKMQGIFSSLQMSQHEAAFTKDQDELRKFEVEAMEKLAKKREELYKPILEKLQQAIDEVARANGFQIIFDTGALNVLGFADNSTDVTELIKERLGI